MSGAARLGEAGARDRPARGRPARGRPARIRLATAPSGLPGAPASLILVLLAPLALPTAATAQTLLGRVLDEVNETPIGGAMVSLVSRDGAARAQALSDSAGRFTLRPPEAGEYFLTAEAFGYVETRSPLLSLGVEGSAPIDLMLAPEPIGLEGLEISVEERAAEELGAFGLSPAELGNRWIGREKIEAIPIKRDMGVILERTAQASLRVVRPENLVPGSDDMGLCVSLGRARTGAGQGRCALVVLDGVPISGVQALHLDPEAIESMAVLEPIEATVYYGTLGGGGAVLVWTRRGR